MATGVMLLEFMIICGIILIAILAAFFAAFEAMHVFFRVKPDGSVEHAARVALRASAYRRGLERKFGLHR